MGSAFFDFRRRQIWYIPKKSDVIIANRMVTELSDIEEKFLHLICLERINFEVKKYGTALITGQAGFVGFHISRKYLMRDGVIGLDCMSEYYDNSTECENLLMKSSLYRSVHEKVERKTCFRALCERKARYLFT